MYIPDDLKHSLTTNPGEHPNDPWAQTSPTKILSTGKAISPTQACDMLERAMYATGAKLEGDLDASKKRETQLQSTNDELRAKQLSKADAVLSASFGADAERH